MRLLHAVAFSPFSRILITKSFRSESFGDSVLIHFKLCVYHSTVAGETFDRYLRSRMNCSNFGFTIPPRQVSKYGGNSCKLCGLNENVFACAQGRCATRLRYAPT